MRIVGFLCGEENIERRKRKRSLSRGEVLLRSLGRGRGILGLFYRVVLYGWVSAAPTGFLRVILVVSGERWCGGFLVVVGWCFIVWILG